MKKDMELVEALDNAYKAMRKRAIEVIKERKEIDVVEILMDECKKENGGEEPDEMDFEDLLSYSTYSCFLEGRHGDIFPVSILRVRYNRLHGCDDDFDNIDVYLKSGDGYVNDWYSIGYIVGEEGCV